MSVCDTTKVFGLLGLFCVLKATTGSALVTVAGFSHKVSVRQGEQSCCTPLQPLPVLQVGIVAFRDPLGAVEEPP